MIEMVPKPYLVRRTCGGYLAVAPRKARFKIAVTGKTEGEAEHKFWNHYVRWCEIVPKDEK